MEAAGRFTNVIPVHAKVEADTLRRRVCQADDATITNLSSERHVGVIPLPLKLENGCVAFLSLLAATRTHKGAGA
jgi:hypothetical protein